MQQIATENATIENRIHSFFHTQIGSSTFRVGGFWGPAPEVFLSRRNAEGVVSLTSPDQHNGIWDASVHLRQPQSRGRVNRTAASNKIELRTRQNDDLNAKYEETDIHCVSACAMMKAIKS